MGDSGFLHSEIREGNRGGQGLFKWEDVKKDRDRALYLGSSLHATIGRWQQNKDIGWYTKNSTKAKDDAIDLEKTALRQAEADAFAEALGYTGQKRAGGVGSNVSKQALERAMKKGNPNFVEVEDGNRRGLGFAGEDNGRSSKAPEFKIEMQPTKDIEGSKKREFPDDSNLTDDINNQKKSKKSSKKDSKDFKSKKHKKSKKREDDWVEISKISGSKSSSSKHKSSKRD